MIVDYDHSRKSAHARWSRRRAVGAFSSAPAKRARCRLRNRHLVASGRRPWRCRSLRRGWNHRRAQRAPGRARAGRRGRSLSPLLLGRGFDVVLCLEVAEHLPEASAEALISSIVAHADEILFSAAIPGQPGQHHVNCQWPTYWQSRFNAHGFSCDDAPRWEIWDDDRVEPWYRQNLFRATRNPSLAGREPRIKAVVHPRFIGAFSNAAVRERMQQVEGGSEPGAWYLANAARKALRSFFEVNQRRPARSN